MALHRWMNGVCESCGAVGAYTHSIGCPGPRSPILEEPRPTQEGVLLPKWLDIKIRQFFWQNHGHDGIYGDDGEMQCGQCIKYGLTDYKRAYLGDVVNVALRSRLEVNTLKFMREKEKSE